MGDKMVLNNGKYYVKEIASITGLSKQLIRKWENRYGVIKPVRLKNGYRLYGDDDLNMLFKIKHYRSQGYSTKSAVQFAQNDQKQEAEIVRKQMLKDVDDFVLRLLEYGDSCNEIHLNHILQQAYHYYGLDAFLEKVVTPFLKIVGDRWEIGEWDAYQESVVSLVVRDFLIQIRRNFQYADHAPMALGACLPGEQHEIPVHIILLKLMMRGWKTTLVGTSPAKNSIQALIHHLQPEIVLLSATTTTPFDEHPYLLEELDQFAGQQNEIYFYLGGKGSIAHAATSELYNIQITNTLDDMKNVNPGKMYK
ncbi:MerR family transcriptional regulator [Virgibacillus sp. NKC19-16]|uniref:MerR family transcriptional regulator n=1 Tax=Virgibacillus salidurans TaxID=2831673 RepID=UPI001F48E993|nr:MerR family transcriptional regulator [Virgibacillus sp. NKC19-16]UJL46163.1 MerR family transcriptional regulator [Virgibacillus sp. NKC19-16]